MFELLWHSVNVIVRVPTFMLAVRLCDCIYTNKPSWQLSYRMQYVYIDLFLFSYNQSVLLCHSLNTNILNLENTQKRIQLHSQITRRDVNWDDGWRQRHTAQNSMAPGNRNMYVLTIKPNGTLDHLKVNNGK